MINETLATIGRRFDLDLSRRVPIEIPNVNRETLAHLFAELGFTRGAEVGVERAVYSETLCQANQNLHLFAVDAWTAYPAYKDHVRQSKIDRFYKEATERMAPYQCTLIKKFSVDAAKDFENHSLDFVYLDGNHSFQHLTADLAAWSPKVRAGGIISGHDFVKHRWPNQIHVPQVIYGWTDAYEIRPWFLLGKQAKVEGELRDDARSFFWVNEPRPVWKGKKPVHQ